MVQLKENISFFTSLSFSISIPYGSIKSLDKIFFGGLDQSISIPYGSIKRNNK